MLATTSPTKPALGGFERLRPGTDLGMKVVEPVEGDEDHGAHQVRAVVHGHVGPMLKRGGDVFVIRRFVFALDRVDRNAEIAHEAGGDVVLGRRTDWRRPAPNPRLPPRSSAQVRRLGGDVKTGRHPHAGERLLTLESLANRPQNRHVALGPKDSLLAGVGRGQVFHIMFRQRQGRQGVCSLKRKRSVFKQNVESIRRFSVSEIRGGGFSDAPSPSSPTDRRRRSHSRSRHRAG